MAEIFEKSRTPIGFTGGPYFYKDYLKKHLSALFLLYKIFGEEVERFTGDHVEIPTDPKMPWNAIQ